MPIKMQYCILLLLRVCYVKFFCFFVKGWLGEGGGFFLFFFEAGIEQAIYVVISFVRPLPVCMQPCSVCQ